MDLCWEKRVPKDDEYDDEGTWIWISMATECRLVLSHVVGERSQKSADGLVRRTAQCLKDIPLFVTDGLKFYRIALLKQYGRMQDFARTGKRGRPRLSRIIPWRIIKICPNHKATSWLCFEESRKESDLRRRHRP